MSLCACVYVCIKESLSLGLIIADSLAAEVRMSKNVFLVSLRDWMELHISPGVYVAINYIFSTSGVD